MDVFGYSHREFGEIMFPKPITSLLFGVVAVIAGLSGAAGQTRMIPTITSAAAMAGAEACEKLAAARGWRMSIYVLDATGMTLYMHRMNGASEASARSALLKARTSWQQGAPTVDMENRIAPNNVGQTAVMALQLGNVPMRGGHPILLDNPVERGGKATAGSIGVAGGTPASDEECARAAQAALVGVR